MLEGHSNLEVWGDKIDHRWACEYKKIIGVVASDFLAELLRGGIP